MYGLVNKAIEDLITINFSEATWQEVKEKAKVKQDMFVSMDAYDDAITYNLVGAASEVLHLSPENVLIEFGKFWITYTGQKGYGDLMNMGGDNLVDFLKNLNTMHARLGMSYEKLLPPSFICEEIDEQTLRLKYYSKRKGLAPMVIGLLQGLGERFDKQLDIKHILGQEENGFDEFMIVYA